MISIFRITYEEPVAQKCQVIFPNAICVCIIYIHIHAYIYVCVYEDPVTETEMEFEFQSLFWALYLYVGNLLVPK